MVRRSSKSEPEAERLDSSQRTLAALEILAAHPQGITPKELSRELGLHLSTCYRLLNTLVDSGYAARSPDSGLFRLAKRVAYLHQGYMAALPPLPGALPFVHALQLTTGESTTLNQLEGDDMVATAIVAGSRPDALPFGYVGMAAPAHAVAAGRVVLAWLPPAQLDAYLARCAATSDSPFPLTNPEEFRAALKQIWQAGYAIDWGEGHPEFCCLAAPIGEMNGVVTASVCLLVPCTRLRQDESALITAVVATARAIGDLQTTMSARNEQSIGDQPAPEAATRAEIEASLVTLAEIMSRVGT